MKATLAWAAGLLVGGAMAIGGAWCGWKVGYATGYAKGYAKRVLAPLWPGKDTHSPEPTPAAPPDAGSPAGESLIPHDQALKELDKELEI